MTNTRDKIQPGWTLTNAFLGGTMPAIIVIVDADGLPVWYFVHGKSADQFGMTSVEWLPNGHVLIGNASAEPRARGRSGSQHRLGRPDGRHTGRARTTPARLRPATTWWSANRTPPRASRS